MIYYYGTVVKNQTPMFFSFNREDVDFVAHHLAVSIEQAYEYIDMFVDWRQIDDTETQG